MANKANYTPYLESIGWREEWLKDESLIIRVDAIKKLMVLCLGSWKNSRPRQVKP